MPAEIIRDQLGHRRIDTTTKHYIRTNANPRLEQFAAALDGVIEG